MRDTSGVGEISRLHIMAALARRGKQMLLPIGDYLRYDLAIADERTIRRVQCKTGRLRNGVVSFATCSVDSRSQKGRCLRRSYRGEIELFGVYCPDNGKCYLVPVETAASYDCRLRITPPRNGQKTHITWAEDYEIV
ncbi:MAG TPA: group I intron-associated PD-(D/E)XK endonuclease [Gemmataceae bacterium]|nr:group I intron-associated PD-(D/E)XK endonuclease [Gemmataceae bacterium]